MVHIFLFCFTMYEKTKQYKFCAKWYNFEENMEIKL